VQDEELYRKSGLVFKALEPINYNMALSVYRMLQKAVLAAA
jgi:hypothetical protein